MNIVLSEATPNAVIAPASTASAPTAQLFSRALSTSTSAASSTQSWITSGPWKSSVKRVLRSATVMPASSAPTSSARVRPKHTQAQATTRP